MVSKSRSRIKDVHGMDSVLGVLLKALCRLAESAQETAGASTT